LRAISVKISAGRGCWGKEWIDIFKSNRGKMVARDQNDKLKHFKMSYPWEFIFLSICNALVNYSPSNLRNLRSIIHVWQCNLHFRHN